MYMWVDGTRINGESLVIQTSHLCSDMQKKKTQRGSMFVSNIRLDLGYCVIGLTSGQNYAYDLAV